MTMPDNRKHDTYQRNFKKARRDYTCQMRERRASGLVLNLGSVPYNGESLNTFSWAVSRDADLVAMKCLHRNQCFRYDPEC